MHVLLVEDDAALTDLLAWHFERENWTVEHTANGDDAIAMATSNPPDIIVLDCMIEGTSGLDVCSRLRRGTTTSHIPIIMVTGLVEEADMIRGFEKGADDYLPKPFSPRILIVRIEALLRRGTPMSTGAQLCFADIQMDVAATKVKRQGRRVALGPTEFRLLKAFLEQPGKVFTRQDIVREVWKDESAVDLRSIDVHIRRLRGRINVGGERELIRTVRGIGYALDDDA